MRVFLSYDPTPKGKGYYVNLPTYTMTPGSHLPISAGKIHADGVDPLAVPAAVMALNPTVDVIIPAEDTHPVTGKPSLALIRQRYPDHPLFGKDNAYTIPAQLTAQDKAADQALAATLKQGGFLDAAAVV